MALGYITCELAWDGSGSPGTNTWSLRSTGSDFQAANEFEGLADLVLGFYQDVSDFLRTGMVVTWDGQVHGLGADEGDSKAFEGWEHTVGSNGADAAEALCIVPNWRSNTGGRKGRGRTFLGPLASQAFTATGDLAAATRTTVQAAADNLVAESTGFTNGAVVVYSRADGLARDITTALVSSKYGVLRSRRD